MHLTDRTIAALKPPDKGQAEYRDDTIPGLSCRVSQGGSKTWSLVYGSPRRRVSLGKYPFVSLKQARELASKRIAHRMLHGDTPPDFTFEEALILFLKVHCAEHNRPSTAREIERLLRRHFLPKLGTRTLKDISTQDILRITDRMLSTPTEANNAHAACRTLFRWATRRRYIPHSPFEGLQMPAKKVPRSRVLTPLELRTAFAFGPSAGMYGHIIRLLILTGQRVGQLTTLRPEFIGPDTITWPAACMKGNREHTIPIGPLARAELDQFPVPCTFTNWSNAHRAYLTGSGLAHHTRHDLRRSYSTVMAEWTPPHLLSRLLAHAQPGVLPVYNRYAYLTEMREAVLTFESWLALNRAP
jgi:integrase